FSWFARLSRLSRFPVFTRLARLSGFSRFPGLSGFARLSWFPGLSGFTGLTGFPRFTWLPGLSGFPGLTGFARLTRLSGFARLTGARLTGARVAGLRVSTALRGLVHLLHSDLRQEDLWLIAQRALHRLFDVHRCAGLRLGENGRRAPQERGDEHRAGEGGGHPYEAAGTDGLGGLRGRLRAMVHVRIVDNSSLKVTDSHSQ
ncbi:hypothetical protein ABZ249_18115, partial [Nocardiopsis sp. NPDC006139]|uniref:hypothetical protein n=1 Tax=Nocardiopsis sp. NPDC006139 TaxID=3154578 RepID=UPI0033A579FE